MSADTSGSQGLVFVILLFDLMEEKLIFMVYLIDLGLVGEDFGLEPILLVGNRGTGWFNGGDTLLLPGIDVLDRHQPLAMLLVVGFYLDDLHQPGLGVALHIFIEEDIIKTYHNT